MADEMPHDGDMHMEEMENPYADMGHGHAIDKDQAYMANINYFLTALFGFTGIALQTFRYRSIDNYYVAGDTYYTGSDGTNYWEIANMVRGYSSTLIWGVLMIT